MKTPAPLNADSATPLDPEKASFLGRILDPPSYGYMKNGALVVPTRGVLLAEFFARINIFASRKNWLSLFGWVTSLSFGFPMGIFLVKYCSIPLLIAGFIYSMVILGSHGTFWLHRYCAHRAYRFRNNFVRTICRNLVIKIIPEETYAVSHHVHHRYSEKPGDPYNVHGGWLYCFIADVNHQSIRRDLTRTEYARLCAMMDHTGVRINSYEQYQSWGTLCHPLFTIGHYVANWVFWYGAFYLMGGHALAIALFGWAGVWAIGVRTFNYEGHGRGIDKRRDGIDLNREDLSINQMWPGYVAGEWHNNHHLFPNGARSGFQGYQLDLPWLFIRFLAAIGVVTSYRDYQVEFDKVYNDMFGAKSH